MYEHLDYEQALEKLTRARRYVGDLNDETLVSLYEGIILADMNRREQSKAAFRSGLLLKPEARLPIMVAPKVEQDFEAVRADVRRELLSSPQKMTPPPDATNQPLEAEARTNQHLEPHTATQVTAYRKHWPAWAPWAVMGSGLAIAAGGGLLHMHSIKNYRDYDAGIVECGGCVPRLELATIRARGNTLQDAAYGTYVLGGAALVGGAVLLYLNQSQSHLTHPATDKAVVNITPLIGDTSGFLATFRF